MIKEKKLEQLVASRRNQILTAAAQVFARKGFHTTTTKDIAREAGIAEGTIYNYFDSKNAILIGLLSMLTEQASQGPDFSNLAPDDLRGFLKLYLAQPLLAPRADNFELFRVVVSEILVNSELRALYYRQIMEPLLAGGESLLQNWITLGLIEPVDTQLLIRTISGVVMGLIIENIMGDPIVQARWEELPDYLAELVLAGIKLKN